MINWIKWNLDLIFVVTVIVGLMALMLASIHIDGKEYNEQCIKAGGTPVFNGEFRECWNVNKISVGSSRYTLEI